MVQFKKLVADGRAVSHGKNKSRFQLEKKFRERALDRMKRGLPLKHVLSSKSMTDLVKRKMKAKKPAAAKGKKRGSRKAKANAKAGGKRSQKNAKGAKTAKDKIKQKAKQNKVAAGGGKSKAKVD